MKNQSGRSLFEMIVVIGIIGLLTVTGISGLGGGTANMRANSLQYDIEEVAKRIIEVNAWRRDGTFDEDITTGNNSKLDFDGTVLNSGNVACTSCQQCDNNTRSCCETCTITTPVLNAKLCDILMSKTFTNVICSANCDCSNSNAGVTFVVQ